MRGDKNCRSRPDGLLHGHGRAKTKRVSGGLPAFRGSGRKDQSQSFTGSGTLSSAGFWPFRLQPATDQSPRSPGTPRSAVCGRTGEMVVSKRGSLQAWSSLSVCTLQTPSMVVQTHNHSDMYGYGMCTSQTKYRHHDRAASILWEA